MCTTDWCAARLKLPPIGLAGSGPCGSSKAGCVTLLCPDGPDGARVPSCGASAGHPQLESRPPGPSLCTCAHGPMHADSGRRPAARHGGGVHCIAGCVAARLARGKLPRSAWHSCISAGRRLRPTGALALAAAAPYCTAALPPEVACAPHPATARLALGLPPACAATCSRIHSSSLQHGYKGIWLKLPASRAHFVGHAVDRGFEFHHAEKARPPARPHGSGCMARRGRAALPVAPAAPRMVAPSLPRAWLLPCPSAALPCPWIPFPLHATPRRNRTI